MFKADGRSAEPSPAHLFPCKECGGVGVVEWYDDPENPSEMTAGPSTCPSCKGSGKSERQLLLDVLGALMLVVELLKDREPAPTPAPARARDSRLDVIGPGLRQKPEVLFPTLRDADKVDIQNRMAASAAEQKGKSQKRSK